MKTLKSKSATTLYWVLYIAGVIFWVAVSIKNGVN